MQATLSLRMKSPKASCAGLAIIVRARSSEKCSRVDTLSDPSEMDPEKAPDSLPDAVSCSWSFLRLSAAACLSNGVLVPPLLSPPPSVSHGILCELGPRCSLFSWHLRSYSSCPRNAMSCLATACLVAECLCRSLFCFPVPGVPVSVRCELACELGVGLDLGFFLVGLGAGVLRPSSSRSEITTHSSGES